MVIDSRDSRISSSPNSIQRTPRQRSTGFSTQLRIKGVTISAPTASPDHQVNQSQRNSCQDSAPHKHSDKLPIVAATAVLMIAAKTTNLSRSAARLKGLVDSTNRRTR